MTDIRTSSCGTSAASNSGTRRCASSGPAESPTTAYAVSPSSEIRLGSDPGRMIPVTLGSVRTPASDRSIAAWNAGSSARRLVGLIDDQQRRRRKPKLALQHLTGLRRLRIWRREATDLQRPRHARQQRQRQQERGAPDDQDSPTASGTPSCRETKTCSGSLEPHPGCSGAGWPIATKVPSAARSIRLTRRTAWRSSGP